MKGAMRLTEEQLRDLQNRPPLSARAVKPLTKVQKWHNEHCLWQGLKFDSKKELADYKSLKLQEAAGAIRAVVRQVSFPLQGSTRRIRVDFLIVEQDGRIRWCDSKGVATDKWLLKQKLVQDAYGITIEVI